MSQGILIVLYWFVLLFQCNFVCTELVCLLFQLLECRRTVSDFTKSLKNQLKWNGKMWRNVLLSAIGVLSFCSLVALISYAMEASYGKLLMLWMNGLLGTYMCILVISGVIYADKAVKGLRVSVSKDQVFRDSICQMRDSAFMLILLGSALGAMVVIDGNMPFAQQTPDYLYTLYVVGSILKAALTVTFIYAVRQPLPLGLKRSKEFQGFFGVVLAFGGRGFDVDDSSFFGSILRSMRSFGDKIPSKLNKSPPKRPVSAPISRSQNVAATTTTEYVMNPLYQPESAAKAGLSRSSSVTVKGLYAGGSMEAKTGTAAGNTIVKAASVPAHERV